MNFSHKSHKLSLIMPCHNEGYYIYRNLHEVLKILHEFNIKRYEIIVVDDGSTDTTRKEALKIKSKNIKVVGYKKNKGKGFALKYGFNFVTGDVVTFIDSDLDIHPDQLLTFMKYMDQYSADIVIGSKRHPQSKVDYPLSRRILSSLYHRFINLLFDLDVTDTQTGLKLLRYECAKKVLPKVVVKRFAFDLELLVVARQFGFKIVEAPFELRYQFHGSRINFKAIKNIFKDTLGIAYRLYVLRYYDREASLPRVPHVKNIFGVFSWLYFK